MLQISSSCLSRHLPRPCFVSSRFTGSALPSSLLSTSVPSSPVQSSFSPARLRDPPPLRAQAWVCVGPGPRCPGAPARLSHLTLRQPAHGPLALGRRWGVHNLPPMTCCVFILGEECSMRGKPQIVSSHDIPGTILGPSRFEPQTKVDLYKLLGNYAPLCGAAGEWLRNIPAGGHTHSHCVMPPSSPRAGCTGSLTFVQETGHIEGIFKENLKEGTEHGVSEMTTVGCLLWAAGRDARKALFGTLVPKGWACESWGPNVGPLPGDLPRRS